MRTYSRLLTDPLNLEKLKELYPSLSAKEVMVFQERHKRATKDQYKFADVLEKAIQNQRKVSILYTAETDNFEEVRRSVSPLAFQIRKPKHENQEFTYVICYNNFNQIRSYRFDRLFEVKYTSTDGSYPEGGYSTYYTYYDDDIIPDFYDKNEILDYAKDII